MGRGQTECASVKGATWQRWRGGVGSGNRSVLGVAQSRGLGARTELTQKPLTGMRIRYWWWVRMLPILPILPVGQLAKVRSCHFRDPVPSRLGGSPASLGHGDANLKALRGSSACILNSFSCTRGSGFMSQSKARVYSASRLPSPRKDN